MSRLGDHKGKENFDIADKKFEKRPNMSGDAVVYQRKANTSTVLPSVPTPLNGNKIAEGGNGTHKKTVDITQYGIPADSGVRWGLFIYIQDGKYTNTQIGTYGTTDWTQGNQVARVENPDKYQHGFTQQFMAPVINNKCYIQVYSQDDDVWQLYFAGVI